MGLILAGIEFGEFGEFWRNSPNLIPAKIFKMTIFAKLKPCQI